MRRALAVALAVGLLAGAYAAPAEAAKKKKKPVRVERVVEFEYQCPCGVKVMGTGPGWQFGSLTGGENNIGGGFVPFDPSTERFLKVESEDPLGMPVAINISMDTDPNDTSVNNSVANICGATEEPIELPDVEAEFRVFVTSGTCADGTPTAASGGVITFTFSNLP